MCYTAEQKNLIEGVIDNDKLLPEDLRLIANVLELITPSSCQSCNKEGYRDMIEAIAATHMMLAQAQ